MNKKLSFIALLSMFSLNLITSPLLAVETDNGHQEDVVYGLQPNQEQQIISTDDIVKEENQEDLTPYIDFNNETAQNKKILETLLKGRVINHELSYIYRIEASNSCVETINTLLDLLNIDIKLQFSGIKKYNNPKDHKGNASFSAEYQIVIEGEIIPETFWINVSRKNPLFTNESNVFGSSVEHICNGTYCHEGKTYQFFGESIDGKNTIRSLNEWQKPSFELIINPDFGECNICWVPGFLYVKSKQSQIYTFVAEKK